MPLSKSFVYMLFSFALELAPIKIEILLNRDLGLGDFAFHRLIRQLIERKDSVIIRGSVAVSLLSVTSDNARKIERLPEANENGISFSKTH